MSSEENFDQEAKKRRIEQGDSSKDKQEAFDVSAQEGKDVPIVNEPEKNFDSKKLIEAETEEQKDDRSRNAQEEGDENDDNEDYQENDEFLEEEEDDDDEGEFEDVDENEDGGENNEVGKGAGDQDDDENPDVDGILSDDDDDDSDDMLWHLIREILSSHRRMTMFRGREKLEEFNTIEDAVNLLEKCNKIIVLTGAGISVSCGIPDFRSSRGIFAQLREKFPDLDQPELLFDIHYFRTNPEAFYSFAKDLYPGNFAPSPCHHFIRMLEQKGKLLRCYTQNIDTLEDVAGIERVVYCHGNFKTASCIACKHKIPGSDIRENVMSQTVPTCSNCELEDNYIKPDIVFYGESLGDEFKDTFSLDKNEADLLIVIGSTLKVHPVASIVEKLPSSVPQVLVNREVVGKPNMFDIELLGDGDGVIGYLCKKLGWELSAPEVLEPTTAAENRFLFPGAMGVESSSSSEDDAGDENGEGENDGEGGDEEGDDNGGDSDEESGNRIPIPDGADSVAGLDGNGEEERTPPNSLVEDYPPESAQ